MAFVRKSGSRFAVHQGNTGKRLSSFGSRKAANAEVSRLHSKNKPRSTNRGASASKRDKKR